MDFLIGHESYSALTLILCKISRKVSNLFQNGFNFNVLTVSNDFWINFMRFDPGHYTECLLYVIKPAFNSKILFLLRRFGILPASIRTSNGINEQISGHFEIDLKLFFNPCREAMLIIWIMHNFLCYLFE